MIANRWPVKNSATGMDLGPTILPSSSKPLFRLFDRFPDLPVDVPGVVKVDDADTLMRTISEKPTPNFHAS